MAAVLDDLASYVTGMIKEMAKEEVAMLIGVSGEIDNLGVKLGDLKDFFVDAERKRITDQSVQRWVRELKEAMYGATDILDLCQLKAMERGGPSKDMGCLNPLLFCMRNPLHAHDIGCRIKALNTTLDVICKRGHAFSFIKLEAYQDRRTARPPVADRKTDSVLERSGVVGEKIEEDTKELVRRITNKENHGHHMVVAVVGFGGIGKTTLAKKVFNDEAIQDVFEKKIWMSITQEFSKAELLRTAIIAANGNLPGDGTRDISLLVPALVDAIRGKKFFLVLDDMWSDKEWNDLLMAPFSHGAAGSRVLVTTRHDTVARGIKAMYPFHHVDKLEPQDAWSLLKKQMISSEMDELEIDGTLKDIGMEIIEKCGGLPLAIKVMGGLLCQREKRRADWEKVRDWSVSQMPQELNYAVYLSYEDLSPYLKQCFMHYSLLPKNTMFNRDTTISMWISEGFLHGESDELEEMGRECYEELILRNLIEPDTRFADHWVCTMHDVVRSFAQHISRDEALVVLSTEIGNSTSTSQKFVRLSIETNEAQSGDELVWRFLKEHKSLRTLISIGELKIEPGDSLLTFSSLRTLHMENGKFDVLVDSLHLLKHLRYLAINYSSDISRLPENMGKMIFLQYISFERCGNLVKLPDSIVKLGQLRYLNLLHTSINDGIPRGFRGLTNLRNLYGFPAHMDMDDDWCSLEELGLLSQLRNLTLHNLENVPDASYAAKARLGEKKCLTNLSLYCTSRLGDDGYVKLEDVPEEEEQRRMEEVFDELCPPPCSLEQVDIGGYYGRRVPRWMTSPAAAAYKSLEIVMMSDLACCTQLPDGLCRLRHLRYFQLRGAPAIKRVGSEFIKLQQPSIPIVSQVAFPKLQRLKLGGMVEWEKWELEQPPAAANQAYGQQAMAMAMPALEELLIRDCKLKCLPPGLASQATTLKELYIKNVQRLNSLGSFASLVELMLFKNLDLERVADLPILHKLTIIWCPRIKVVEGVPRLQRLGLEDYDMKALPGYMMEDSVNPKHLLLNCSLELLTCIAAGKDGPEWDKLSRIQHVKAYTNKRVWYVLYTREPYSFETNITSHGSTESGGSEE